MYCCDGSGEVVKGEKDVTDDRTVKLDVVSR